MKPRKSLTKTQTIDPRANAESMPVTNRQIAAVKRNAHLLDGKGSLLTLLPEPKTKKKP